MKKIIFIITITTTLTSHAFFLEPLFQLRKGAQELRAAVEELTRHKHNIRITKETKSAGVSTPTAYRCYTEAASKSFDDYLTAENALAMRIFTSQCLDGLLLGGFAALLNTKLHMPLTLTFATIASAITIIFFQNKKLGYVPYYDAHLRHHPYTYKMKSILGVLNLACILAMAQVGAHTFNNGF